MLSGRIPFQGVDDEHTVSNIKTYNYDKEDLQDLSLGAQSLIKSMLLPENLRISIHEVLEHPWIANSEYVSSPKSANIRKFSDKLSDFS